jgi:hypothetical protein
VLKVGFMKYYDNKQNVKEATLLRLAVPAHEKHYWELLNSNNGCAYASGFKISAEGAGMITLELPLHLVVCVWRRVGGRYLFGRMHRL